MKSRLLSALCASLIVFRSSFAHAVLIGVTTRPVFYPDAVYAIDQATGSTTLVTLTGKTAGAYCGYLNGELYCANLNFADQGIIGFGKIDLGTGEYTFISDQGFGTGNNWSGVAANQSAGVLSVYDRRHSQLKIVTPTGEITNIGTMPSGVGRGDFAYDDRNGAVGEISDGKFKRGRTEDFAVHQPNVPQPEKARRKGRAA